ncbi:sulfatase-like hydrolase/transferase [Bradyrhizobium liaoningense]|uniref:sulfatase-like hydrolase/transferase n=1 Tax=Bradyrhizobium liaoningense TaxID=43992 RepID=UPI001BAA42FF|nr:sulfatase-like hydrolase/transferase [Bradyrhizobium liaoningense]MBR0711454.1 sulfatase-like hydrolase/transferase [Bradyrhizobium liaoningense]
MRRRDDHWLLLRSLATAAALSTVALLDFYAENIAALAGPGRVLHYAAGTVAITAIVAAGLKILLRRLPLWRILLATGLMVFVFFSYDVGLIQRELKAHLGQLAPLAWVAATSVIGIVALAAIRNRAAVSVALVLSAAFAAPSIARIAAFALRDGPAHTAASDSAGTRERFARSPNIYWIVLDGYPRQDVLAEDFKFDNSDFIRSLRGLDFAVLARSRSNFPATVNSISSTASFDYTVESEGETLRPLPLQDMQARVRGKNRTVARLTSAGYTYVHFENGYDYLTECAPDQPRCVRGNLGLDELDIAILSNTPLVDLVVQRRQSTPFAWGGVDDLDAKLNAIRAMPSPFFLYAHVLAPHPPIRFRSDCSFRPADPDLQRWIPEARPTFIEQLTCVNSQTLALLHDITQADPGALIILQSDHGTAFRGQFKKPPTAWTDEDLHERFGALNAMRLPHPCRAMAADDLTLIDTFPLVLACLSGAEFKPHHPRFFVTPYDDSADFGRAIEYSSERVR